MADGSETSTLYFGQFRPLPARSEKTTVIQSKIPHTLLLADGLVYYFKDLKCGRFPSRRNGKRVPLTGREVHAARIWPWDFAKRMAWGVVRLLKKKYWQPQRQNGEFHYPSTLADDSKCIARRQNRPRDIRR